ncbi:MAG: hypothetical protein AB2815_09875, partial [Candidatus Sedimenticola endophacoides]
MKKSFTSSSFSRSPRPAFSSISRFHDSTRRRASTPYFRSTPSITPALSPISWARSSPAARPPRVSLPRERFWDIPVPKIDSPTRQPLLPRP